jgi:acyl-CoA thioester hydrolase
VTVEFEDVDSYGIVHHTKLVAYLERARVRFLTSLGLGLYPDALSIVLYGLDMRFKKPAFVRDVLLVSVSVGSCDDYRLRLRYRITRNGALLVSATTGVAFMNASSHTIVPAPADFVEALKQWDAPSEDIA